MCVNKYRYGSTCLFSFFSTCVDTDSRWEGRKHNESIEAKVQGYRSAIFSHFIQMQSIKFCVCLLYFILVSLYQSHRCFIYPDIAPTSIDSNGFVFGFKNDSTLKPNYILLPTFAIWIYQQKPTPHNIWYLMYLTQLRIIANI